MKGFDLKTNTFSSIEERITKCLNPHEIQSIFGLHSLKEHYEIPVDNEGAQSSHNQRLRGEFRAAGLFPDDGDYNVTNVDAVHRFDRMVREADRDLKINLKYSGGSGPRKRRESDDL